MDVHTTGPASLALFVEPDDLRQRGARKEGVDVEVARVMAMEAFEHMGMEAPRHRLEIEAFMGRGGMVVFAALQPDEENLTVFYTFDTLDQAIQAARGARGGPDGVFSSLVKADRTYYMTVSGPQGAVRKLCWTLDEFALRRDLPESFAVHLGEHGQAVVAKRALGVLARY